MRARVKVAAHVCQGSFAANGARFSGLLSRSAGPDRNRFGQPRRRQDLRRRYARFVATDGAIGVFPRMGRRAVRCMHASFSMTSCLAPDGGRPPMPLLVRSIPGPGV